MGSDQGYRFQRGIHIHKLLETLPDLSLEARLVAGMRYLERAGPDISPTQRREMLEEVLAILDNPAFAPLFGPESRAEVPLVGTVGGRPVVGQIDRLAMTQEGIWLVDYKTNRPAARTLGEISGVYWRQMALYWAALAEIFPDRPIHAFLLWTDGPRLMALPEERLREVLFREMTLPA
jgi:ATP-dependent helicase/nuclease subunit A